MIQDLPLLPEEWSNWDWTCSNGIATAEQTQIAYNAVLNQGQCVLFSRFVWNDIVDCLGLALEAAGIGWSNRYCSAEACKINVQYGGLTATAFNSVRYNIDRFGIVHWTWADRETKEGYIGRVEVRGFEKYASMSDKVYGWYIIELTKRLNTLLDVLKDTADFSDMENMTKVESIYWTEFGRAKSSPIVFTVSIPTHLIAEVARITVRPLYTFPYAQTKGMYEGTGILSVPLEIMSKAGAPYIVETDQIKTAPIRHCVPLRARYKTEAARISTGVLTHRSTIHANVSATLRDAVFVGYLRHTSGAISHVQAEIENYRSCMIDIFEFAESNILAEPGRAVSKGFGNISEARLKYSVLLDVSDPRMVIGIKNSHFYEGSILEYKAPVMLAGMERVHGQEWAYLDKRKSQPVMHHSRIHSYQESDMRRFRPVLIGRYIETESFVKAAMTRMVGVIMGFMEQVKVNSLVELKRGISSPQSVMEMSGGITAGELTVGVLQSAEVQEQAQGIPLAEVGKLQAKDAESESAAESFRKAGIVTSTSKPVTSSQISECFDKAEADIAQPKPQETQSGVESYHLAGIMKGRSRSSGAVARISAYISAEMCAVSAKAISAIVKAKSGCTAELSKDTEDIWKNPLQSRSDLYIRSAHPQWQEGSTVHMDNGGVFYEADQTETNVYIRSVDSMKGV